MVKKTTRNIKWVYNLEFPSHCHEFEIFGYLFKRIPEYVKRVQSLQHIIGSHSEFPRDIKTGIHAITSHVVLPQKEKRPVMQWEKSKATALDDILFLLSIFTYRDVFAVDEPIKEGNSAIVADPRKYYFGLRTQYKESKNEDGEKYDIGFQDGLSAVYNLMRKPKWKIEYGGGRFFFLFKSAARRQTLETSFSTCWTIWEILFTLHNQVWLADKQILRLPASEKISFILTRYDIKKSLDATDRKGIKRFVDIRNKLIHAGHFSDRQAVTDAVLFIRITRMIIAKIIGLSSEDVLGAKIDFIKRLRGQEVTLPLNI